MQVDAYNYNEWGLLTGKVSSISSDVFMDNKQPYFKIRCQLDQHSLQLKNGYQGKIKKGMTIQAHFHVAKRSIYQLLYDKTDNWLNPKLLSDEASIN
jgi:HlyD family secretion protein